MSGPWDDYAAPAESSDSGPWNDYQETKAKPTEHSGALSNDGDGWGMGALKGAATGVIKGLANATPLTWAANSGNLADYVLARAESKFTGKPLDEVMAGMEAKRKAAADGSVLGRVREAIDPSKVLPSGEDVAVPVLKVTGEYKPESLPGKIAQGAVEAGVSGLGGGAGAPTKALGLRVPSIQPSPSGLPRVIINGGEQLPASAGAVALKSSAAMAPMNAVAGGAGAGVTDVTGDPLLGMAAGMVAPGAIDKAKAATSAKLRGFTQAGREEAVGARLRATADDPDAVAQTLMADQSGPLQTELVPGSMPTAAELTGDMGLLEAQRHATNTDGIPFSKQRDAGSSARRQALENLSPDADVMKPGELFQSQLDAINKGGETAIARIQEGAQKLAEQVGPGNNPEANGAAIRSAADAVYQEIRGAREALYKAIDPDEKLNIVAAPAREKVAELLTDRDPFARPMEPEESRILAKVQSLPDVVPFKSLRALDEDITSVMSKERQANGESPAYRQMAIAKSAVMDAINKSVENQHAYEQAAVSVGKMKPADTISARLEQLHDDYHGQLGRARDAQSAAGENAATGTSGILGDRPDAGVEGGRSGIAPGGPSVSEGIPAARLPVERRREVAELRKKFGDVVADKYEAQQLRELAPVTSGNIPDEAPRGLQPNMDKAATDRLREAKDKHIELAQTSRNPTIAPVLKTNGFAGQYKMRDSAVPSKAVLAGPQGYEAAKTFLKATKSEKPEVRDAATAALLDTALAPLREKMGNGMISQSNLDAWKQKHAGVLRALDEVSPGFSKRFDSAAKASDDLVAAGDSVKQEIADFQKSAASKLLGHRYPSEVEEAMGTLLMSKDGPSKIDALMKRADKDAIEGMQKAAVDYLVRKLTSAQEAGADGGKQLKGATFDNVLKNHKTALERLLPRDSIARMEKISRANEIASRQSLTRVVGGPGTAKDTNPIMKKIAKVAAHNNSLLGAALSGMYLGHTTGGLMGALVGGGLYPAAYAVAKLKAARVETLDAMFRDAILSPERARYYWAKIPPKKPETGPLFALSKSLRRELATIPTLDLEEKRRPVKRAAGGSVMGSPPAYNQAVADALFG